MDENTIITAEETAKTPIYNNVTFFKVFSAICATLLAGVTSACFITCFGKHGAYLELRPITYIWCGLIALTVTAVLVACIISKDNATPTKDTYRCGAFVFVAGTIVSAALDGNWLLLVLAILTTLFFTELFKSSLIAHTFLGFVSVGWCVAIIAQTYFSYDMPVNAPYKLLCQFGVALGMILILSNIRFTLDAGKTGIYKFFACLTLCINVCATVAGVIITAKKPGYIDLTTYLSPALTFTAYSMQIFLTRPKTDSEPDDEPNAPDISEPVSIEEQTEETTEETVETNTETGNTFFEDNISEKGQYINEDND